MEIPCDKCGNRSRFQFSEQTCYAIDLPFPCCPVCGSDMNKKAVIYFRDDGTIAIDSMSVHFNYTFYRSMLGHKMVSKLVRYEKHCLAELAIAFPHVPALLLHEIFEYLYPHRKKTDLATRSTFVGRAHSLAHAALYRASCTEEAEKEECQPKKLRRVTVE